MSKAEQEIVQPFLYISVTSSPSHYRNTHSKKFYRIQLKHFMELSEYL